MKFHLKTLNKSFLIIIELGVIWGLLEATAGFVIHIFHLNYLIPLLIICGVGLMIYGVIKIKNPLAALPIAFIAALIKMMNLLFIGLVPIGWIIMPSMHILFEGTLVTVAAGAVSLFYRGARKVFFAKDCK